MSYGDRNIFNIFFLFIIEKFDFLVEMPPEREVLWFFSKDQINKILKYSISETRKCGLSDGTNHRPRQFFLDFPGY